MSDDIVTITIPTWLARCHLDPTMDSALYQLATMAIVQAACREALKETE
jgi:hypothetical protein